MSADGRSILTSAGILESGAWMHDTAGDHLISPEGYAAMPSFSHDGRHLYYLLRRERGAPNELWTTDIESGKSAAVVTGLPIDGYDISADGSRVVLAARTRAGVSQLWLAPCDGQTEPRLLAAAGESQPFFGPEGEIVFRASDGARNYLFEVKADGSHRRKVMNGPIIGFKGMSPDRTSAVVMVPVSEVPSTAVVAISIRDGSAKRICPAECMAKWSPDGARFYVAPLLQGAESGRAVVVPVPKGVQIPELPAFGVRSASDARLLPTSTVIDLSSYDPMHFGTAVAPGLSNDTFAFTRTVSHRNLFQLRLPD
jgi:hypothetical protein